MKELAKQCAPIAEAIAKNCKVAPQLVLAPLIWGIEDLLKTQADAMERMVAERDALAAENEALKRTDVLDLLQSNQELRGRLEALARTVMSDMGNHREPLTKDQINRIVGDVYSKYGHLKPSPELIVRAIEAAHGIGV